MEVKEFKQEIEFGLKEGLIEFDSESQCDDRDCVTYDCTEKYYRIAEGYGLQLVSVEQGNLTISEGEMFLVVFAKEPLVSARLTFEMNARLTLTFYPKDLDAICWCKMDIFSSDSLPTKKMQSSASNAEVRS